MKKVIMGVILTMIILVGCTGPKTFVSDITEVKGLAYGQEQEDMILFSDLEKEFQNNNINLIKESYDEEVRGHYSLEDDQVRITVLVDTRAFPDQPFVSGVFIDRLNKDTLLSEQPAIKAIASLMGEEQVITWVAAQEEKTTGVSKSNEPIKDVWGIDRCYLFFEDWPERDTRRLEFRWALKPHIPVIFEAVAGQIQESGLLVTGYLEGPGGETLVATNPQYYLLKRIPYPKGEKIPLGIDQAAAYQIMHDTNKTGSYSVQLYGYMGDDLAYPARVEAMPGLKEIIQLMNMGQDEFAAIADQVNRELTEAKRIRNNIYKGEYYVEGEVGEYRYTITVPQGIVIYNFTVLIEKI